MQCTCHGLHRCSCCTKHMHSHKHTTKIKQWNHPQAQHPPGPCTTPPAFAWHHTSSSIITPHKHPPSLAMQGGDTHTMKPPAVDCSQSKCILLRCFCNSCRSARHRYSHNCTVPQLSQVRPLKLVSKSTSPVAAVPAHLAIPADTAYCLAYCFAFLCLAGGLPLPR